MSSLQTTSSPEPESHSPGSSASTRLQEEYDDLLRYAVVTPQFDPRSFPPLPEARRRSPLAQTDVMAREADVLADGPQENPVEEESTGRGTRVSQRVCLAQLKKLLVLSQLHLRIRGVYRFH
jgi:hypothetical protein